MTFDASALLNQTVEGPMATQVKPIPEGEYMARIGSEEDDVKIESFAGTKDPSKTYYRLTLMWEIIDENLKAALERDKITVRDQFLLDVDPISGQLKTGPDDNVSLGQRREAVGMNDGSPFSIPMFRGKGPAMLRIRHRANDKDPQIKYAEVARVVKLG